MKSKVLATFSVLAAMLLVSACSPAAPSASNNPSSPTAAMTTSIPSSNSAPTLSAPASATPAATSAPSSPSQPAQAPVPGAPPKGNPPDVIVKAYRAVLNVPAYRMTTTSTLPDGRAETAVFEFVQPDRAHVIQGTGQEIIVIKGQGTWLKMNGTWTKSPADMSEAIFQAHTSQAIDEIAKSILGPQAAFVGPDILNGKPMLVYQYSTVLKGAGPNQTDANGSYKIWIGATDGLPYKLEGDSDSLIVPGTKAKSTSIFEYDPSIKIEAPH